MKLTEIIRAIECKFIDVLKTSIKLLEGVENLNIKYLLK